MKKFLQACELGESIYGRKKNSQSRTRRKPVHAGKDMMGSYRTLYKEQLSAMDRVFGRNK